MALFPFFNVLWNSASQNEGSKIILNKIIIDSPQIWIIFLDKLSQPYTFLDVPVLLFLVISYLEKFYFLFVKNFIFCLFEEEGDTVLFFVGEHVEVRKPLKILAFVLKLEPNFSPAMESFF